MKEIDLVKLSNVCGGYYDPDACGMATSIGGLVGGVAGGVAASFIGLPNIGFTAGAAAGAAAFYHFSPACHGPSLI
jgi:hypothetical protein